MFGMFVIPVCNVLHRACMHVMYFDTIMSVVLPT